MQSITISTNSKRLIDYITSLQSTYASSEHPHWNFTTIKDLQEHLYQSALIFCSGSEVQTTQDNLSFTINTSINKKPRYNVRFIISSL